MIRMRQMFANRRSAGYLALGAAVLVVVILVFLGGRVLLGGTTEQADEVTAPDPGREAATTPAKKPTERQEPKETTDHKGERKDAEKKAEEAKQGAADQYAAEWAAVQAARDQASQERASQEQAAADQYAAEWAAKQEAQKQAAIEPGELAPVDSAELFPEAMATPSSTTMYLTVPSIGLDNIPVVDDISEAGLSQGAGHLPGTGFPWIPASNTYIAGHRLGYPGTPSDQVFYNLPSLGVGDEVILMDASGQSYTYAVSEVLEVPPTDLSVTAPVPGRDVVTLQTCIEDFGDYWTPGPDWLARYVVRADRV